MNSQLLNQIIYHLFQLPITADRTIDMNLLKKNYKKLCLKYHPDKNNGSHKIMTILTSIKNLLEDNKLRECYEKEGKIGTDYWYRDTNFYWNDILEAEAIINAREKPEESPIEQFLNHKAWMPNKDGQKTWKILTKFKDNIGPIWIKMDEAKTKYPDELREYLQKLAPRRQADLARKQPQIISLLRK